MLQSAVRTFGIVAPLLALAIVLDALAFTLWDIGTRPPLRLLSDVASGLRHPARWPAAAARALGGIVLLAVGAVVVRPAIPNERLFTIVETGTLVVALFVEQLVGPELRARVRRR